MNNITLYILGFSFLSLSSLYGMNKDSRPTDMGLNVLSKAFEATPLVFDRAGFVSEFNNASNGLYEIFNILCKTEPGRDFIHNTIPKDLKSSEVLSAFFVAITQGNSLLVKILLDAGVQHKESLYKGDRKYSAVEVAALFGQTKIKNDLEQKYAQDSKENAVAQRVWEFHNYEKY